jgi:hypothetical protein
LRNVGDVWGPHSTAITMLHVAGFARLAALVKIEALAVVPEA